MTYQRNYRSKERKAEEDVAFRMRENSRKRDKNQKLFTLFLCGIVLLIIEIGFAFFRTGSHNSTEPSVLEDTMEEYNTIESSEEEVSEEATENDVIVEAEDTETADESEPDHILSYTDNPSASLASCLEPDSFAKAYSQDGSFSFIYPKYLFNYSREEEDALSGYYLSYEREDYPDYSLCIY